MSPAAQVVPKHLLQAKAFVKLCNVLDPCGFLPNIQAREPSLAGRSRLLSQHNTTHIM
jgi:hypothetical protein